ncbi:MAG: RNA methyltransferase [Ignavibacteriales bacterium]|nr:MAG: RNA methyltransferase [Ignavibacteriaceae bacterium]MBW7873803.1 RNA methyltransferase [Ignavibacteria bacterium]MCZ2144140.1 RNA methyltransferase [Ignavibacteriales bacterium]OQY74230.1 MAG: RNA methyltransferase [Ignavibacteriales bacterium UTCHB3]MBV6445779.1 tRNA (guanosine(18)-2'-O)-methyltransferase [Ignavibacteriaceae bacterium]
MVNRKLSHAEISANRAKPETLHQVEKMPVVVLLDSIRSSYNVGSVFRTSDGAMIEKLYLCGYTPTPPVKDIMKTALGATESVMWEWVENPEEVVKKYREKGYKIAALELTETSIKYSEIETGNFPLLFIIGNEIKGVNQALLDLCDFTIEIPQYGIKQSLNVAVAYGIAVYEMRKKFDEASGRD